MFLLILFIIFLLYILYSLVLFIYKLFVFLVNGILVMLFSLIIMVLYSFKFLVEVLVRLLAIIKFNLYYFIIRNYYSKMYIFILIIYYSIFILLLTPLLYLVLVLFIYNFYFIMFLNSSFFIDFIDEIFDEIKNYCLLSIGLALLSILGFYVLGFIYIVCNYCYHYFSSTREIVYYNKDKSISYDLIKSLQHKDLYKESKRKIITYGDTSIADMKIKYIVMSWQFLGENKPCKLDFIIERKRYRIYNTLEILEVVRYIDDLINVRLEAKYKEVVFRQVYISGVIVYKYISLKRNKSNSISFIEFLNFYMFVFRSVFFKRAYDSGRLFYEVDWADPDMFNFVLWENMIDEFVYKKSFSIFNKLEGGSMFYYNMPFVFNCEIMFKAPDSKYIDVKISKKDGVSLWKVLEDLETIKKAVNLEIKEFSLWEGRATRFFYNKSKHIIVGDKKNQACYNTHIYNEWVKQITTSKYYNSVLQSVKKKDMLFSSNPIKNWSKK